MAGEVKPRVDRHEEVLDQHDERISQNERYRLQMEGAIKFAGFVLGGGGVTTIALFLLGAV